MLDSKHWRRFHCELKDNFGMPYEKLFQLIALLMGVGAVSVLDFHPQETLEVHNCEVAQTLSVK